MQSQQYRYSQPCSESSSPALFYGYCHDSRRMRMMNYPDYVSNMQTGYSNLYKDPYSTMQQMAGMMQSPATTAHHGAKDRCGKCHGNDDCGCECCIRCADTVEYARCGETRKIPITFENDSRRERAVTLELASFMSDGGQPLGWQASMSETQFTLVPCGEKTVLLTVTIDCGTTGQGGNADAAGNTRATTLDACKVGYATLRADGCMIRPLVIAVAALPDHCGAHHIGCLCGCCC